MSLRLFLKKLMSLVNILDVQVLDNPATFKNPFQFEITFECFSPLEAGTATTLANPSLLIIL